MQEHFKKAVELLKRFGEETLIKLAESKDFEKEYKNVIKEKTDVFKKVQDVYGFTNDKMKVLFLSNSIDDAKAALNYTESKNAVNKSGLFLIAIKEGYGKKVKIIEANKAVETSFCLTQKIDKENIEISEEFRKTQEKFFNIPEEYRLSIETDAIKYLRETKGIKDEFLKYFPQVVMHTVVQFYERRVKKDVEERS